VNLVRKELNEKDPDIIYPYVNDQSPDPNDPNVLRVSKMIKIKKKADLVFKKKPKGNQKSKLTVKQEPCVKLEPCGPRSNPKSKVGNRVKREIRQPKRAKIKKSRKILEEKNLKVKNEPQSSSIWAKHYRGKAQPFTRVGTKKVDDRSNYIYVGPVPRRMIPDDTPILDLFSSSSEDEEEFSAHRSIKFYSKDAANKNGVEQKEQIYNSSVVVGRDELMRLGRAAVSDDEYGSVPGSLSRDELTQYGRSVHSDPELTDSEGEDAQACDVQ